MPTFGNNSSSDGALAFDQNYIVFVNPGNPDIKKIRHYDLDNEIENKIAKLYADSLKNPSVLQSKRSLDLREILREQLTDFWATSPIIITQDLIGRSKKFITFVGKQRKLKKSKKQLKEQKRKRERRRKMRIKSVSPLRIPFNVSLNIPEVEGQCMSEYIKNNISDTLYYRGDTVQDLIDFCEEYYINIMIYDILLKPIYENKFNKYKTIKGIIFNEHFYPLKKNSRKLKRLDDSYQKEQIEGPWLHYYIGNKKLENGLVLNEQSDNVKFHKIESKLGYFNYDTERYLKNIKAMNYTENAYSYVIDKSKAYYSFAKNITKVGLPSIEDVFVKGQPDTIYDTSYYLIKNPIKYIRSNVVSGKLYKLLTYFYSPEVPQIIAYLDFKTIIDFPDISAYENNKNDFRIQNGIWGIDKVREMIHIIFPDILELKRVHYDNDIGIINEKKRLLSYTENIIRKPFNYRYLYYSVVEECNVQTMKLLIDIHKEYSILPTYIKTDALGYEIEISVPEGYKSENWKQTSECKTQFIKDFELLTYDNKTILGPPGTAKTKRVFTKMKYDIACTNDNSLASRHNIITTASLFSLFPGSYKPSFDRVQNKIIWVDEISKVSGFLWAVFQTAYHHYNTRFIFTGSFKQFEAFYDYSDITKTNFLGHITQLNDKEHQERSTKEIVELGERVESGDISWIDGFRPSSKSEKFLDKKICELSLCFTNEERHKINNFMLDYYNLKWGDKGIKVKCLKPRKGFVKGELYTYDGTWKLGEQGKSFELGYAITAFSSQGFTIEEDISIYEWKRMKNMAPKHLWTIIRRCRNTSQLHFQ